MELIDENKSLSNLPSNLSSNLPSDCTLPFECTLTKHGRIALLYHLNGGITGFCSGAVIGNPSLSTVFFRMGTKPEVIAEINREFDILSKLQQYDCVPRLYCLKQIGQYTVLFTEFIEGTVLEALINDEIKFKAGVKETLRLAYKLYSEIGFSHCDLHLENIMVTPQGKVYFVDFPTSVISYDRVPWYSDLSKFIDEVQYRCLENHYSWVDKIRAMDLSLVELSTDPKLYLEYINKVKETL